MNDNSRFCYGQVVVLGYRSYVSKKQTPVGSANTVYKLCRKDRPNGFSDNSSTGSYKLDENFDYFQIGRMPSRVNDLVIPGKIISKSSAVSRFAARIRCSRNNVRDVTLYASGFDRDRKTLFTVANARTWCFTCRRWMISESCDDEVRHRVDSLTKNGVKLWRPEDNRWYEVSINGLLYPIEDEGDIRAREVIRTKERQKRVNKRPSGGPLENTRAILSDGCLIDLGGIQLQYQESGDTATSSSSKYMALLLEANGTLQCPIQLIPLSFNSNSNNQKKEEEVTYPFVFPTCGHVMGYNKSLAESRVCPLCRKKATNPRYEALVPLLLTNDSKLSTSHDLPQAVFNPCGHAVSKETAEHYGSVVKMQCGKHRCPFCSTVLDAKKPYSTLYFYNDEADYSVNNQNEL